MEMIPDRWSQTEAYVREVFGLLSDPIDLRLAGLMGRAAGAGLPQIAVSPDVGRLLMLLASVVSGHDDRSGLALEIGTLGGYSGMWIARGLGPGGRLITVEADPAHAAFARSEFDAMQLDRVIELHEGKGLDAMPELLRDFGPGSFDLVFLDAVKTEYRAYAEHAGPLLRRGGLLIADNCLGSSWWITDAPGSDEGRDAMDAFNRWIAHESSGYLACCVANREGLVVARKL
ncbi:MAG TPA: class I SAM-dependent methyltransferase [Phycisphaerales bacterium]|nr:class I SAM-dependent methyltransferase [Phycisphaerales bacterium]